MSARRVGYASGFVVLVTSGVYVFVYLYRWEWNRALFAGFLFVATEVALASVAILERLRRLGDDVREVSRAAADPVVLGRIREAGPPPRAHFAWLTKRDGGELSIFVPVLMGAGVVMSGLAWGVERLARATAQPVLERRLAASLATLAFPADGLLPRRAPETRP